MANEVRNLKTLGIRVPPQYYDKVKTYAQSRNRSLSDVMRQALDGVMEADSDESKHVSTSFQQAMESFQSQLEQKDKQIDQLHQLLAMKENSAADALSQLNRANLQIEDLRRPRSAWQRIKAVFADETG